MNILIIDELGKLLTAGFYSAKEGLISMIDHESFTPIDNNILPSTVNTRVVSRGPDHILLLDDTDRVWVYGHNNCGQLGLMGVSRLYCFQHICTLPPIKHISVGRYHSLALDYNGQVWISGYPNHIGKHIYTFSVVGNIPEIQYITAAGQTSLLISSDGDVLLSDDRKKCRFLNLKRVNYVLTEETTKPIIISGYMGGTWGNTNIMLIDNNGNVWEKLRSKQLFRQIRKLLPINSLSIGLDNVILLDFEGNIWVRGRNDYGQLGINSLKSYVKSFTKVDNIPGVKSIYCGYRISIFVDIYNTIWVCGECHRGKLGLIDNSTEQDIYGFSWLFDNHTSHPIIDNQQNIAEDTDDTRLLIRQFTPLPYIKCKCLMNSDPTIYSRIKSAGSLLSNTSI